MKLIVGLGNPGKEYELNRHNTGFMFIDNFAKHNNTTIDKEKFNGLYTKIKIKDDQVLLLKPLSYMNLSGEVVEKFANYYKINLEDILIISDDLDLDVGRIRLRQNGSSGGHNGLKNIALHLNSNAFKRLRIGISKNRKIETKDYVLSNFSKEEFVILKELEEKVNNVLYDFCNNVDFEKMMSIYNKTNGD